MAGEKTYLGGRVVVHGGDCRDVLEALPCASVDSVVTDPPYSLVSIVKRFGKPGSAPAKSDGATGVYQRASAGFMGKQWDTGETAFAAEFWSQVLRVLRPGGHLIAFSGTRTYHRMVVAIEDAGFEIRDQIGWAYGSGFPKSHNVAKAIDRKRGVEGKTVATGKAVKRIIPGADQAKQGWEKTNGREYQPHEYIPGCDEAREWQGWGTALKPAWEPICVARKPLVGTVAENVLEHGTGALNIDGGRVVDRFPANLIHDGSDEVIGCFPSDAGAASPVLGTEPSRTGGEGTNCYGEYGRVPGVFHGDAGSAARFFYTAKADSSDRIASKHPTIKPIDLMQYFVRLVTPRGGVVLDPFAGTGTTGEAAWREGMRAILIEREAEYLEDIKRRMDLADKPSKRAAVVKTKGQIEDRTGGLLDLMEAK